MVEKRYTTYEGPLTNKVFTFEQMKEVYRDLADKTEYPDFECWFADMMKSGVFKEIDCFERGNSFLITYKTYKDRSFLATFIEEDNGIYFFKNGSGIFGISAKKIDNGEITLEIAED